VTANRRVGASAPARPVPQAPAHNIGEVVIDTERDRRVRVVLVIRHERTDFKCLVLHSGAHTKECLRSTSTWFQYAVTPDIRMGRHNNARRIWHQHKRNLTIVLS